MNSFGKVVVIISFCAFVFIAMLSGCVLFEEETYILDVRLNEEEAGSVRIDPQEEEYAEGTEVTLTAVPEEGWAFKEWQGDAEGTDKEIKVEMDEDKEVTAVFIEEETEEYSLTITVQGNGEVLKDPDQDKYDEGTEVTLTTVSDDGWKFKEWQGDANGTEAEIEVEMDGDKDIIAVFVGEFSGGTGSPDDPFKIGTPQQLYNVREYLDKNFIQIENIDLSDYSEGEGWDPIGSTLHPFTGVYDGDGYTISGLTITSPTIPNRGLFGRIRDGQIMDVTLDGVNITGEGYLGGLAGQTSGDCSIMDVHVSGIINGNSNIGGLTGYLQGELKNSSATVDITGESQRVGGLVGFIASNSQIDDSYATGTVTGGDNTGGLVGRNNGNIIGSYAEVQVIGEIWVGGLVGYSESHTLIKGSWASGIVEGQDAVGGLVGTIYMGEIRNSYATETVDGNGNTVGGLVGKNDHGLITTSYARGAVKGEEKVGGLVGNNYKADITNSYATGSVTAEDRVGGLVGDKLAGSIEDSYAIGKVDILDDDARYFGGLVGNNYSQINNSYYNTETTEMIDDKGYPRTTEEMTYPYAHNTFIGWDFEDIWGADENNNINGGYPYLRWQGL